MEGLISEEEAAPAMGEGEAGRLVMATTGDSEEIGTYGIPGGAVADGGNAGNATSKATVKAGAGSRHGARTAAR